MQDLVAPVTHIKFEMEVALDQQLGSQPLPFPGMDSEQTWLTAILCPKNKIIMHHIFQFKFIFQRKFLFIVQITKRSLATKLFQDFSIHYLLPLFNLLTESGAAICTFYLSNVCSKGVACPYRHVKGDRTVVCKHWLRGLCKKGDDCEFLHEFDMSKMPECYFFSKFGEFSCPCVTQRNVVCFEMQMKLEQRFTSFSKLLTHYM